MILCTLLTFLLAGQEGDLEDFNCDPDTSAYCYTRPIRLNEWAAGVGGSVAIWGPFNPVTFYPFGYFLPMDGPPAFMCVDDPLDAIDPLWPTYIVVPLGSAATVYFYGRLMKDSGSAAGAILGSCLGEAAWLGLYFGTRELLPENAVAANAVYLLGPIVIGTGTFCGYHLLPSPKRREAEGSSNLIIQPHLAEHGPGVRLTVSF